VRHSSLWKIIPEFRWRTQELGMKVSIPGDEVFQKKLIAAKIILGTRLAKLMLIKAHW